MVPFCFCLGIFEPSKERSCEVLKVLVLSHMYPVNYNPVYGIFVHKQVKALSEAGIKVRIVSPKAWAPWPIKHLSKNGRPIQRFPSRTR